MEFHHEWIKSFKTETVFVLSYNLKSKLDAYVSEITLYYRSVVNLAGTCEFTIKASYSSVLSRNLTKLPCS